MLTEKERQTDRWKEKTVRVLEKEGASLKDRHNLRIRVAPVMQLNLTENRLAEGKEGKMGSSKDQWRALAALPSSSDCDCGNQYGW